MSTITVIIEFADKNLSAYVAGIDGIVATGLTLAEVKESIAEAVNEYRNTCIVYDLDLPQELQGDYTIEYKLDLATFLFVYGDILSKSGLQNLTGINQKQLWHYANGKSKPRQSTINKVADSIRAFATELSQVQFA